MTRKIEQETLQYNDEKSYYQKERNALLQQLRDSDKQKREETMHSQLHEIEMRRDVQYNAGLVLIGSCLVLLL